VFAAGLAASGNKPVQFQLLPVLARANTFLSHDKYSYSSKYAYSLQQQWQTIRNSASLRSTHPTSWW
jgi:hypothetical protein